MALKIKKQIKNSDGTITELEGTEAEVEAFLKKQSKKDESLSQKKKNLILGKEMRAAIQEMIAEALLAHARIHSADHNQTKIIEHHWYHNNGWWWRPTWVGGNYVYQATNHDPTVYGTTNFITCNSADEMGKKIGLDANAIGSLVGSGASNAIDAQITTTQADPTWYGAVTNAAVPPSVYTSNVVGTIGSLVEDNFTSGMINVNMKS